MSEPITITHSTEANVPSVLRLAALDDRRRRGPFHHTAEIVELLRFQARQEVLV